jgi:hypothetical protein
MVFSSNAYSFLQFQSFNAIACDGRPSGAITGSRLNQCSLIGSNREMRRCDVQAGEIVVQNFAPDDTACTGEASDTYRLPVGCVDTPGGAGMSSASETCMSASNSNIFASFTGSALVTLVSDNVDRCNALPNQANSWMYWPLGQCIPAGDGTFVIIGSCDASGTYTQTGYSTSDCSGSGDDLAGSVTMNLDSCMDNGSGSFRRQICVTN